MEQWTCKACGYTHMGDEPPERCSRCGAPSSQFYKKSKCKFEWSITNIICFSIIAATLLYVFCGCSSPLTVDNSVISTVDLQKFQGKWYEIARFDHRFERDMTHCTALYTQQKDGTIKVVNTGIRDNKWKISEGCAKKTVTPALLRVSFCGPFYSDYRILMLAPDYSYALIGGSSDKYLWILSRTPILKLDAKHRILQEAQRRGYDTQKLIWVTQSGS